jgi:hypothetical protein
MKGITTMCVTGLLILGLIPPAMLRAQESEAQLAIPAKAPKLTLPGVEAQVTTLQGQVSSLQSAVNSLQSAVTALQPNFAVVNKDGTLARGSASVVSSESLGGADYQVVFNRDVSDCAYSATIGEPSNGVAPPAFITVATLNLNPDGVFIEIINPAGKAGQVSPFHLTVTCR